MKKFIDTSKIPPEVVNIAQKLKESGGEPYIVGGSIRDILLGKTPSDWDIAVNLRPEEVLAIFPNALTIGIEFGRVSVGNVDVVSLRGEADYQDRRHPSKVHFGVSIDKDLERRDFTVNAMAWDPFSGEIFDPFDGYKDLCLRVLNSVGDPFVRFQEDPLRILRAIRFKDTIGFNLHPEVIEAILESKELLAQVSGERIFVELRYLLLSPSVYQGVVDLYQYGLSAIVLPELNAHAEEIGVALSACSPDLLTRLGVLFGFIYGGSSLEEIDDAVEEFKDRFNLARYLAEDVKWLAANSDPRGLVRQETFPMRKAYLTGEDQPTWVDPEYVARRIVYHWGKCRLEQLIEVKQAIWRAMGQTGIAQGCIFLARGIGSLSQDQIEDIETMRLALGGNEIIKILNIRPSPIVGDALDYLEEMVLRDPKLNNKESLSEILKQWWSERQ
ncbi:MAG: CCA tRNA nucleotidyltransferase [Firmicutes bacterium]|nr:CCA tRNA nucleotidyltransferase [Candidatus Fermentithermobacillaceae bacterium]